MNAAAMSFNSGAVMELTGQRIEKVNKELHASHLKPLRWAIALFDLWFVPRIDRMAMRLMDDAIWFKGVDKEVWQANDDVRESTPTLLPKLLSTQEQLLTVRKELLELSQHKLTSPGARRSLSNMLAANADLFDSIESFRWTLMELEANHSPRSEGWVATTPEGVAELFRRIQQEA
jgi:hypothetical protein